ncbi:MAG: hypothetical protein GX850_02895 [Clostridiaceae bacterium]|nr:hypothetical protein [Clostridiaceae bacterium]
MKKRNKHSLMVWALTLALMLNALAFVPAYADGGKDVSGILTVTQLEVKQNGSVIGDEDEIDSTGPISVKVAFDVPVVGDYPDGFTEGQVVREGDFAVFTLSDAFTLVTPIPGPIQLKAGDSVIGYVTLSESDDGEVIATVEFFGDDVDSSVFSDEGDYSGITAWFSAELGYDSTG